MDATDVGFLERYLGEHLEVYGKKPPDQKMIQAWFRTLKPLHVSDVRDALVSHSRNGKFPATPAHVFEYVRALDQKQTGEMPTSRAAIDSTLFWHANDLLIGAHIAWTQGMHRVRAVYDSAMANACEKAKSDSPGMPLPDAMRALIAKLPHQIFPKAGTETTASHAA